MEKQRVDSSSIFAIGRDQSGTEIQFHAAGCKVRTKRGGDEVPCDCEGGDTYHFPLNDEEHAALVSAPSIGGYFMRNIRHAKKRDGSLRYPGTKREATTA